jgi:hypothetical protein
MRFLEAFVILALAAPAFAGTVPPDWYANYGSTLAVSGDDNVSESITLPFTFNFGGQSYNDITISNNGFLQLGPTEDGSRCCDGNVDQFLAGAPTIAPYWLDLVGSAFYDTAPDRVIITWDTIEYFAGPPVLVQAQLLADGGIIFGYHTVLETPGHDILGGISTGSGVANPGSTILGGTYLLQGGVDPTVYQFILGAQEECGDCGPADLIGLAAEGTNVYWVNDAQGVPEPGTITLFGTGLVMALATWRKRRA